MARMRFTGRARTLLGREEVAQADQFLVKLVCALPLRGGRTVPAAAGF